MKRSNRKKNPWADHYTRQARKDQYPARSVYKLKEIQKKHRILKKGHRVLDLGCAPGSWLIYAAEQAGPKGHVLGIDIKPVTTNLPAHAKVIEGDIFSFDDDLARTVGKGYHAVISDMAPATTGNRDVDALRSMELCRAAFAVAGKVLAPGGTFVCKVFQGEDVKDFSETVKAEFGRLHIFKPKSSRKASREIFLIALKKKTGGDHVRT